MKFCMQCGHELGASRTCPSCGTTAPVEPLPAPQLPPAGARYPLFADEVDSVSVSTSGRVLTAPVDASVAAPPARPPARPAAPPAAAPPPVPPSSAPPSSPPPAAPPSSPPPVAPPSASAPSTEPTQLRLPAVPVVPPARRASAVVWVALGALVVVALVLGVWLLLRGGPSSDPKDSGSGAPQAGAAAEAEDVAGTATASAPVTRPPGEDTQGNKTSYDASNMLDGDPTTAWEMPGDGSGKVLTLTLAKRSHLTQVGLINGYAKIGEQAGQKVDWYAGNRRVLKVEWLFDDGSVVSQDLSQTRKLQTTDVDVTTKTVRLRLVEVSGPGKGKAARDMTAVSEVGLSGTTG